MVEIKKIVAPLDIEDEGSDNVLAYAANMAKAFDAELILMHAVSLSSYYGMDVEDAGDETVKSAIESVVRNATEGMDYILEDERLEGVKVSSTIMGGEPSEEILRIVGKEKADMIVMGNSGCSGFGCYIFGSVAHKVLQTSPIPVTIVHPE